MTRRCRRRILKSSAPAVGKKLIDRKTGFTYIVTKKQAEVAFSSAKSNSKNVTTIGASAFQGCSKLTIMAMGTKLTTIGDKAFYKCTALTKITIPAKVAKIGKSAFQGYKKLKTITIKSTKLTAKKVGAKAFTGTAANATVKVPKKSLKAYKSWLVKKGINKKAKIKS